MRRILVLVVCVGVLAGLAPPLQAAPPNHYRDSSISANAFWYLVEQLSPNSYRQTTWYVGVYQSKSYGTFSDLYQEVIVCRNNRRGETCRTDSYLYGDSDLSGQTFTIDERGLTQAHIDAVYALQKFDSFGNPVGDPVSTHIVTDWTGIGDLAKSKGKETYRSGCAVFRYSFNGLFRQAEATGSVEGSDIGETYDAWMSTDSSTSFERVC